MHTGSYIDGQWFQPASERLIRNINPADTNDVIAEFPDNVSAAAVSLNICASGAVRLKTVALLNTEEIDEAAKKTVPYRPPGT